MLAKRRLHQMWQVPALWLLLLVALVLRLHGMNWDGGRLFHPDERQVLMVAERLALPSTVRVALSADSPLNPRFFAYGSFPLYLIRVLGELAAALGGASVSVYSMLPIGRALSALFDTLTILATYRLSKLLFGATVAVLSAGLLTFAVLHIQLSHFYAVDTLLTALIVLAVTQAVALTRTKGAGDGRLLGVWYGLALATKASALPFGAVIVLAWLSVGLQPDTGESARMRLLAAWRSVWRRMAGTLAIAALCFLVLEPYALIDFTSFICGIGQEIAMSQGWYDFPYTRQYFGTVRYLYSLRQMLLFTAGPCFTLLGVAGLAYCSIGTGRRVVRGVSSMKEGIWLVWPVLYGLTQGGSYAKFVRYMLPLFPFLAIAGAVLWVAGWRRLAHSTLGRGLWAALGGVTLVTTAFYGLAFLNIYAQPHPWLQASDWLCQNMASGTTIMVEYWDDPLPALPSATEECPVQYDFYWVDMYAADGPEKLEALLDGLERCEYIVLSSDRLYATISRLPQRYPLSSCYYRLLFSGELGYELALAPAVYPRLGGVVLQDDPRAGISLPPLPLTTPQAAVVLHLGRADESFSVYDHPQPLVFRRVRSIGRNELSLLLQSREEVSS